MSRETLTVTDNRTGTSFEVPIERGAIRAGDITRPFDTPRGPGLVIYDPGFPNTASCFSSITNINLEPGLLEHRGYRIEALAEHSNYVEVAYLLIHGELPNAAELSTLARRAGEPEVRARERQALHPGLPLRRPPDGDGRGGGRRARRASIRTPMRSTTRPRASSRSCGSSRRCRRSRRTRSGTEPDGRSSTRRTS